MSALQQLRTMTTIVADTGDLAAIARLKPIDATTNPSLITKALLHPDNQGMLSETMSRHNGNIDAVIDALTIQVGCDILELIQGRVSTEVDARLSYDTQATIDKALAFMEAYQKAGVNSERVLIKMAATWQGIEAARYLETQNIHCNLTLLFGQHQAIACADAGVTLISPFVGRILDWQKRQQNRQNVPASDDMGVQSVKRIYQYYKQHNYNTQVMGASFRSTEQILALAGCDLLTIAPDLIDALAAMDTEVIQQLSPSMSLDVADMKRVSLTREEYSSAYQQDTVTQDLLPKGIDGFIGARDELAQMLAAMRH
ncbi:MULTISPECIES: transaldolase [Psychrobacter]|uniref:transaldolase n=1 Tax=Psychrobacter immobilis TaxID=498 RepID=A0A2V1ZRU9_PSYIM|nr:MULTISPECIES: transaldolase [Psychrobacter]MBE8609241.1 transaldolase [Pseudomonas lundensis]WLG14936.1 transaldolase [Psychrobacter cibarius]MCG3808506.1 transaldolase [Psychrobacter sp. Ps4]MDN5561038.1 transaldolase [Psychrobacter sp.]PWK05336.1 transaldolase [Psychrobacter immobilis]